MNGSKEALGMAVKEARKRNRMTIETLASRLGKSAAYISKIENGVTSIDLDVLENLSFILNTPLIHFLTTANYIDDNKDVYYRCLQKDFITFVEMINKNMYYNIDTIGISPKDMDQSLWTIDTLLHTLNKKYPKNGE